MTTVADLVERAAARNPEGVAVVAADESVTYADLETKANRLAHHLHGLGVGPGVAVGVCLHRSVDLAVALLAVLKAGGACVPLDPSYPPERLAYMAGDAAVVTVLTHAALVDRLPAGPVVRLDSDAASWGDRPGTPPVWAPATEDVAYVIYTSGSTGRAKGVLLTHRGLVSHHQAVVDLYALGPRDRVLQFCSIGFDASIEELFPTWAAGATVVFRPEDTPLLGRGWLAWLRDMDVAVMNLPTAYWHAWTAELEATGAGVPGGIRLVIVGGERALGPAYRTWVRVGGGRSRWVNAYGPTETTCMSTYWEGPPEERDPPIGWPLPGTTVAVVDEGLQPVPASEIGELLIGGPGLARGYLNAPDLTAERFVVLRDGRRMYRTGDLVREAAGGELEYVGRVDDQVKIQGFRVECGEVQTVLAGHPDVAQAVVVAPDDHGERRLVAYVVGGAPASGLRSFLAERLPAHMVPAAFVTVDALPLTPNGKVDRTALPAPASPLAGLSATRSPEEDRMAAIWAAVLEMDAEALGPADDFFDLGGHSLLATQVMARVHEEFGTETPLLAIFQAPTLGDLTALVVADAPGPASGGPPLTARRREPGERFPLSLAQEQMWALEARADPPGLYNVTALHRFEGPVDESALRRAVAYVVDRHEVLRAGFGVDGDRPYQFVSGGATVHLVVVDARGDSDADLHRRIAGQDAKPFDVTRPPLLRAALYLLDGDAAGLAVTLDHLICDGTGAEIFLSELLAAYREIAGGRALSRPPLPVQFLDFAAWQRAHVTNDVLRRQLDWWKGILDGMPLGPAIPFDHVPDAPTRRIASTVVTIDPASRARLEDVARATGSTVFTVTVAAVGALFGSHTGSTDVVFSTTLSGRTRAELEDLVGMFSGIGRLRTDLSGDPPFMTLVTRVRERVLGMFENQDIPFMRVRRALLPDFPTGGPALVAALPTELQYFYTSGHHELFFRGQLHPLSLTLLDDGNRITAEWRYKLDYYEPATIDRLAAGLERVLAAVGTDPSVRVSETTRVT